MKTDASEKEMHIQMWRESGLSKAAYARESGLNPQTFYSWFYTGREKEQENTNTLLEIVAQEKYQNDGGENAGSMSIGITLPNGYNLIVPSGFQSHSLHAVLDVLEGR